MAKWKRIIHNGCGIYYISMEHIPGKIININIKVLIKEGSPKVPANKNKP